MDHNLLLDFTSSGIVATKRPGRAGGRIVANVLSEEEHMKINFPPKRILVPLDLTEASLISRR
jgi:hypothetical protein